MLRSKARHAVAATALTLTLPLWLSACGGGGSGEPAAALTPPSENVQGIYTGTSNNPEAPDFDLLVLEDGSLWAIYGTRFSNALSVTGFVQGDASFKDGQLSSSNIRDHGFVPAEPARLTGTYTDAVAPSVSGQLRYSNSTVSFSARANTAAAQAYDTPASIADISGTWTLDLTDGERASINISAVGAIGGSATSGCRFSGQATPRPNGKNVFNVSIVFNNDSRCALPGQTGTGVAISYTLADSRRQLIVLLENGTRDKGVGAFGVR